MKTALVTGGYGFLGSHLVEELELNGYEVTIMDTKEPTYGFYFPNKAKFIKGDIRNCELPDANKFEVIFHCAGLLGTETLFDRVRESVEVNVIGTVNILEWAKANPYITVLQPNLLGEWLNPYMITKHCAEDLGMMYYQSWGLKYLSIRPSDVYGPRQRPDEKKAAAVFLKQAYSDYPIPIYGNGTSWVNYVYVKDVARFLVLAYEKGACGEIIDFCRPGGDMGIIDFARAMIKAMGSHSKMKLEQMRPGQPGNIYKIPYSTRRACEIMPASEFTSLEEGLRETVDWYKAVQMD